METTTCQICGRSIKASNGIIAHHGYRRPGDGWQTASCAGARHMPYEISRDFIPVVIDRIKSQKENCEKRLAEFIANPPDELSIETGSWQKKTITARRPANFNSDRCYGSPHDYGPIYANKRYAMERQIAAMGNEILFLANRFDRWEGAEDRRQVVSWWAD